MDKKVIVITGVASGMGLESAKLLATKGAKLSLADVQEEALMQVVLDVNDSGGTAIGTVVDVRERAEIKDWIKTTVDTFGKLDGSANLAGVIGKYIKKTAIQDIDDEDWDFVAGANQKGLLTQIPHFNNVESIVNASGVAGLIGFPHAVMGLAKTAAKELGPRQIRCNAFCPGPVETPMFRASDDIRGKEMDLTHIALGRKGQPKEVANLIEWLLSDGSSLITGTV
ncbi:3-alpha--hydroxysteroid dehydrogenase [Ilyonectria sp. MPI-CAGE-AT-0026]|nr:3-alpha--hydroxysteroid dehydrogenase [Ilyonectria sp. MPI-CAGE-AT-0026]